MCCPRGGATAAAIDGRGEGDREAAAGTICASTDAEQNGWIVTRQRSEGARSDQTAKVGAC